MKTKLFFLLLLFISSIGMAQSNTPQMADDFRGQGKIYVVIAVIGIIFLSLAVFLVYLEKKLSRLEKEMGEKK
jgi:prepilin signal peptidase PulO-like enzyme (type II secretory pathway)